MLHANFIVPNYHNSISPVRTIFHWTVWRFSWWTQWLLENTVNFTAAELQLKQQNAEASLTVYKLQRGRQPNVFRTQLVDEQSNLCNAFKIILNEKEIIALLLNYKTDEKDCASSKIDTKACCTWVDGVTPCFVVRKFVWSSLVQRPVAWIRVFQ